MKKLYALSILILATAFAASAQSNILDRHNGEAEWVSFVKENMCLVQEGQAKEGALPNLFAVNQKYLNHNSNLQVAELALGAGLQPNETQTMIYKLDENHVVTVYSVQRLEVLYKRYQANKKAANK
ncbi:MAG: hypothetical protein FJX90_05360 [Bacteroidetes bacterium]|nr:hypothetical protein [Bacteroidota bacterium]